MDNFNKKSYNWGNKHIGRFKS